MTIEEGKSYKALICFQERTSYGMNSPLDGRFKEKSTEGRVFVNLSNARADRKSEAINRALRSPSGVLFSPFSFPFFPPLCRFLCAFGFHGFPIPSDNVTFYLDSQKRRGKESTRKS